MYRAPALNVQVAQGLSQHDMQHGSQHVSQQVGHSGWPQLHLLVLGVLQVGLVAEESSAGVGSGFGNAGEGTGGGAKMSPEATDPQTLDPRTRRVRAQALPKKDRIVFASERSNKE
jgi:hypothetical protein